MKFGPIFPGDDDFDPLVPQMGRRGWGVSGGPDVLGFDTLLAGPYERLSTRFALVLGYLPLIHTLNVQWRAS